MQRQSSEEAGQLATSTSDNDHQLALSLQELEVESEKERMERWQPYSRSWKRMSQALGAAGQFFKFVPRVNSGLLPSDDACDDSRRLLEGRIKLYGMREVVVKGDGNCQFRALAEQLYGDQSMHGTVRKVVAQQLRLFGELYREHVPGQYEEYCSAMARDGEWGDHVTLKAAADVYHTRIVVLTSYESACFTEIEPRQQRGDQCLYLSFWAEVHYNSLHLDDEWGTAQAQLPARGAW